MITRRAFFGRDFIKVLVVAEPARRTGVGTALLDAALATCTSTRVFTSTNQSNAATRALLECTGWTPSGALAELDEGDDELVYWHDRATCEAE